MTSVRNYTLTDEGSRTIGRAQRRRHQRARLIEQAASEVIDAQAALEAWEAGLRSAEEEDRLADRYAGALRTLAQVLRDSR